MSEDGLHVTRKGKVVYKRPKHIWNGLDMTRIVVKVNNYGTGSAINWHATMEIAQRNWTVKLAEELSVTPGYEVQVGDMERFLKAFDDFVNIVGPIFELVPGAGTLVSAVIFFYNQMRRFFYGESKIEG